MSKTRSTRAAGPTFSIEKGELALEVRFSSPILRIFRAENRVIELTLEKLKRHGVQLQDIRVDLQNPDLTKVHVLCDLPLHNGSVRFFADRLLVQVGLPRQSNLQLEELCNDALSIARAAAGDAEISAIISAESVHATISGRDGGDLVALVTQPIETSAGPATGASVVYKLDSSGSRTSATIRIEPSLAVAQGVFVQSVVGFSAKAKDFVEQAAAALVSVSEISESVVLAIAMR